MAQATRTLRIFVSSTLHDLKEERKALQKHVSPGCVKSAYNTVRASRPSTCVRA